MLTSLLPGIRELRVPLATGYVWLVALAIALEPYVPERAQATGLSATLYRIGELISVLGVGVGLSFVAYLLGSLSVGVFSRTLRRLFRQEILPIDHVWGEFTGPTADAIGQLATEARARLEQLLALSDTSVSTFIEENLRPRRERSRARQRVRRAEEALRLTSAPAPSNRQVDLARLREAIVADLEIVLTTRLLGRDAELYSAVDRHRSEAEFRLGLIPPLVAATIAVAAAVQPLFSGAVLVAGAVITVALHWDALNQQRKANAMLVDALADHRVASASLERLETKARELADRSKGELMDSALRGGASALRRAIDAAKRIDSQPSSSFPAMQLVVNAREHLKAVESVFPLEIGELAERALDAVDRAITLHVDALEGREVTSGWADEARRFVTDAETSLLAFRETALAEIDRVREEEKGVHAET